MGTVATVLLVLLLLVFLPVSAAVVFRFVRVRGSSTPALWRRLPDGRWHYGAFEYTDGGISFYRLVSLKFGPDFDFTRSGLELGQWREPLGEDLEVADPGEVVVPIGGVDRRDRRFTGEVCLGRREATALLSWVEACSTDHVRTRNGRSGQRRAS